MDPLEAVRSVLPGWVVYGNAVLCLGTAAVSTLLITSIAYWISRPVLPPEAHWTERAREMWAGHLLLQSVFAFCFWIFGVVGALLVGPISPVTQGDHLITTLIGLSLLGLLVGGSHLRRCRRTVTWHGSLRRISTVLLAQRFQLVVIVAPMILLPAEIGPAFWILLGVTVPLLLFAQRGGGVFIASRLGLLRPAPDRLVELVREEAGAQGIAPPGALVGELAVANAWALPLASRVVFTRMLLDKLDERQLRGVVVHELAHIGKHRVALLTQASSTLPLLLVLMGIRPILAQLGLLPWMLLVFASGLLRTLTARFAIRMEVEADGQVRASSSDDRSYAEALERIHEVALTPAVTNGNFKSHPDLYDRLKAAGVTPEYPRPEPPLPYAGARVSLFALGCFLLGTAALAWFSFGDPYVANEHRILRAIAVTGGSSELLEKAGTYRLEDDDLEVAETLFRGGVAIDPDRPEGHARLALALAAQGRMSEARVALERAEDRMHAERHRYPEAIPIVQRARAAVN